MVALKCGKRWWRLRDLGIDDIAKINPFTSVDQIWRHFEDTGTELFRYRRETGSARRDDC